MSDGSNAGKERTAFSLKGAEIGVASLFNLLRRGRDAGDRACAGGLVTAMGIRFVQGKPSIGELSLELIAGAIGVMIVVVWGLWLAKRQEAAAKQAEPGT